MIENHYLSTSDIYKLPIMDFSLYYTKIVMNINTKLQKMKEMKKNKKNYK